jgi:hypothetical protein
MPPSTKLRPPTKVARKYAHLREQKRRADVEAQGRADVADLYEDL